MDLGYKKRKKRNQGVWQFCKIQYIILLYINSFPHPNGSLILSPKSPNLKSQTSLSLSLSLSPPIPEFSLSLSPQRVRVWRFSREGDCQIFSGTNNNIFPVRGFPCRRWHGSRGRCCQCQRGKLMVFVCAFKWFRLMGFFVLSYVLDWWVYCAFICFRLMGLFIYLCFHML